MNDTSRIPWGQWTAQVLGLLRLELHRILRSRAGITVVILAGFPVAILLLRAIIAPAEETLNEAQDTQMFAILFSTLFTRFVLFLGALEIFGSRFASDQQERILHLYLLSPLKREVLVAGKYVAGVVAGALVLLPMLAASFACAYLPHGTSLAFAHLGQFAAYALVTLFGIAGYGALFLLFGSLFKNPTIPALLVWGWEWLNPFLPAALKQVSVVYYLDSLCPLRTGLGPIAVIAEPASPWLAVPGLAIVCALLLSATAWRMRRIEINYGAV